MVLAGRILRLETSGGEWTVHVVVSRETETGLLGKVPGYHHVNKEWRAAAAKTNIMNLMGIIHLYRSTVGEILNVII